MKGGSFLFLLEMKVTDCFIDINMSSSSKVMFTLQ